MRKMAKEPEVKVGPKDTRVESMGRTTSSRKKVDVSIANSTVVEAAPQTDGKDGTSQTLFPDFGTVTENPDSVTTPIPEKKEEPKKEEAKEPEFDPDTLLRKYADKKVKIKVDGQEGEASIGDLLKNYQTMQHLSRLGNQIGTERRTLAEEKRQLEELKASFVKRNEDIIPQQPESNEIAALKAQINQLQMGLAPVVHQSARQRVSDELKAEGHDDFLEYIPKMDVYVATVSDPQKFDYYNTPEGAKHLFLKMKWEDERAKRAQVSQPATIEPRSEEKPPVVKIESGNQPSGGVVDDYKAKYAAAFKFAQENPNNREAWNDLLRIKGVIPS
jgi:hypothetical protein